MSRTWTDSVLVKPTVLVLGDTPNQYFSINERFFVEIYAHIQKQIISIKSKTTNNTANSRNKLITYNPSSDNTLARVG